MRHPLRLPPVVFTLLVLATLWAGWSGRLGHLSMAYAAGSTAPIQGPIIGSTVAALPTCNAAAKGKEYMINDATAPAWNATVAGAGAVVVIVFCNGTNWVVV